MDRTTISGSCSFIIVLVLLRYVVHVKPQLQQSNSFTFCSNKETIKVPVFRLTNAVTIPCWTMYGGSFNSSTDILVYKGTRDTNLTLISGQDILTYVTRNEFGFRYNFTGDPDYLGNYTCLFANSSGENYVNVEVYRGDNAASVYTSDCSINYSVNNTGTFFCRVEKDSSGVAFEWSFKMRDGGEVGFSPKRMTGVDYDDGTVVVKIRQKLSRSDIVGVVCRGRRLGGVVLGYQRVVMKELKVPEVLDNETVSLYVEEGVGLSLNCSFKIGDSSSRVVFWLRNGIEMGSYEISWSRPVGVTTLNGVYGTTYMANYTCVAMNSLGFSSKTFLVYRRVGRGVSGGSVYSVVGPVVMGAVVVLLLVVEWKRRTGYLIKFLMQVWVLKDQDPCGSSLMVVEDTGNGEPLAKGAHGEVWETTVKYQDGEVEERAVLKTFTGSPFLSVRAVELLFDDLINEIKICQRLSRGDGCRYVVRYIGVRVGSVQRFQVYLILEYCYPGQLLSLVRGHGVEVGNSFVDDVGEVTVEERRRLERDDGYKYLAMSHLMRWAYQIAQAVKFLHDNNIVHRDLAARNVLLKGPTDDDRFVSYDQVNAKLADFGLSRFVHDDGSYVINEDTPKPRKIPVFWYPPESFGSEPGVEYTKKSDVWSFGVLLWEMFSLGLTPNGVVGYGCGANDLKMEVLNGKRLGRGCLKTVPDELWTLMEDCWLLDPSERPDFYVICQRLGAINERLGICEERDFNQDGNAVVGNADGGEGSVDDYDG